MDDFNGNANNPEHHHHQNKKEKTKKRVAFEKSRFDFGTTTNNNEYETIFRNEEIDSDNDDDDNNDVPQSLPSKGLQNLMQDDEPSGRRFSWPPHRYGNSSTYTDDDDNDGYSRSFFGMNHRQRMMNGAKDDLTLCDVDIRKSFNGQKKQQKGILLGKKDKQTTTTMNDSWKKDDVTMCDEPPPLDSYKSMSIEQLLPPGVKRRISDENDLHDEIDCDSSLQDDNHHDGPEENGHASTKTNMKVSKSTMRILKSMTTGSSVGSTYSDESNDDDDDDDDDNNNDDGKKNKKKKRERPGMSDNLEDWFVQSSKTDMSWSDADTYIKQLIEAEFPKFDIPTAREVINVGRTRDGRCRYRPGEWVEIRGPDMKWRLDMITRVVKQAPSNFDWTDTTSKGPEWNFFYHCSEHRMLNAEELRSPKEGLIRIFGHRPWVWQQWACLKLEYNLRFQKGHQNDFESKDTDKYAAELWDRWLNHPCNEDFRKLFYDARVGEFGRTELVHHIMKPFKLMDKIKEDDDTWDFFRDDSISVYTYLSILGSGFVMPFLVLVLQVSIPYLLYEAVNGTDRFFSFVDRSSLFGTISDERLLENMMVLVVLILYGIWIVPDNFVSFYNTLGAANTTYSRLLSMRQEIWNQGDDRFGQMLGFRLDIYMNTAYVCLLYMLNIYIIMNTDEPLDIILNSLAFEFVARIDEEITKSDWWDPNRRWIAAGTAELVLQRTLQLRWLENPTLFSEKYNIPLHVLLDACDGDNYLLRNRSVAMKDVEDISFMTKDEIIKNRCRLAAIEMQNDNAIQEYEAPTVHFGYLERFAEAVFRRKGSGLFNRFASYRTWSRWEKVLYLSPLPNLDDLFQIDDCGILKLAKYLDKIEPTVEAPFANFDAQTQDMSYSNLFIRHVIDVLELKYMLRGLKMAWIERKYIGFAFRLCDGLLQWMLYVVQISFPVYVLTAIVGTFQAISRNIESL